MKTKYSHIVVTDRFECLHCGETHKIELPISLDDFVKKCKAFTNLHKDCKKK